MVSVWTGGPRYVPGDVDEDERRRDHLDALRHERETLARRIARLRALPANTAVVERDTTGLSPTGLIVGATKATVLADEQVNLDEIDRLISEGGSARGSRVSGRAAARRKENSCEPRDWG
jgi:hypothetical protein